MNFDILIFNYFSTVDFIDFSYSICSHDKITIGKNLINFKCEEKELLTLNKLFLKFPL